MKFIKYISVALVSLLAFASCDSDLDKVTYHEADAKMGTFSAIKTSYVFKENIATDTAQVFTWTEATFGYDAAVIYEIEIDSVGKNFKNKKVITSVIGKTESVMTVKAFNEVILSLDSIYGTKPGSTASYEVRLAASIGDAAPSLYSDVQKTSITTYLSYPKAVYMIGTDFGNWTWSNQGVVDMIPVNGAEGTFWTVRYFKAANGFKWNTIKDWNGDDFFELDSKEGYTTKDGNAFVPADGFYIVYLSYPNKKITIKEAEVYGMGECFGGWTAGAYAFTASGENMTIKTTAKAELRMYASAPIAGIDWWKMEFILLDGKIVYRGNGGDQERVVVDAGKTITLNFNAGTGTIQ